MGIQWSTSSLQSFGVVMLDIFLPPLKRRNASLTFQGLAAKFTPNSRHASPQQVTA